MIKLIFASLYINCNVKYFKYTYHYLTFAHWSWWWPAVDGANFVGSSSTSTRTTTSSPRTTSSAEGPARPGGLVSPLEESAARIGIPHYAVWAAIKLAALVYRRLLHSTTRGEKAELKNGTNSWLAQIESGLVDKKNAEKRRQHRGNGLQRGV